MRDATIKLDAGWSTSRFQSTHPMRDATGKPLHIFRSFTISIHASHAGCDPLLSSSHASDIISIHASHAGCDFSTHCKVPSTIDFNPRIPCGMRHCWLAVWVVVSRISIHASHAGCDVLGVSEFCQVFISIHASHAGCDVGKTYTLQENIFQSTHPMRDATVKSLNPLPFLFISIHASHAGCDSFLLTAKYPAPSISIHASHAGCDSLA